MPGAPVFELVDVGLRRSGREILRNVDWEIGRGERWVVLGPNGAGKTSLVRILSTYLAASSGTVDVLGCRIGRTNVAELRPLIGYLSPSLAHDIPEQLTPRQLVDAAQAGAIIPWYIPEGRIDPVRTEQALADVGLAGDADRPFATLSSGERLRVELARALVADQAALLLDEPMASLDLGGRETLMSALARFDGGRAVVVVLHRVEDIPPGFSHALLLRDGLVRAAGPIDDVLTDAALSACFDVPVRVRRVGGRWTVASA